MGMEKLRLGRRTCFYRPEKGRAQGMNIGRKITALLLSTSLLLTAAPLSGVLAAADTAAGDPWKSDAAWSTQPATSRLEKGQTYFTGKEWTGEEKQGCKRQHRPSVRRGAGESDGGPFE